MSDPLARGLLQGAGAKLHEVRAIALDRLNAKRRAGIGTPLDQEFDAAFEQFIDLASKAEMQIGRVMAARMAMFRRVQISPIVCSLLLFLLIGVLFRKYVRERQEGEERSVQAQERAEAANSAKSQFVANMSHEIRTPMTAIVGFAEVLLEDGELAGAPSEMVDTAKIIRRNGEYLLALINDILDLSKVEAGKMSLECIPCNPCVIIADIASLMRAKAAAKGLSFEIDYAGAIPETIQSDPTRLRQVLVNLIGNSIKFTETGGVTLITRFMDDKDRQCMQFDVVDTGVGMTQEQADRLFQPFTQADTSTTRKFGGTGLGLTISKRFAEMFGGDIVLVNTEKGTGTQCASRWQLDYLKT